MSLRCAVPVSACGVLWCLGKSELLELECAELFELAYIEFEVVGGHVLFKRSLVLPCFANHEHVGAGRALKGVVSNVALVLQRSGGQGNSGLQGLVILALVGLEKTV